MNLLNVATGGLTAAQSGSALTVVTGAPAAGILTQDSPATASAGSPVSARDSLISQLPDISASVNLLQQAAAAPAADPSLEPQLTVPPLPPMPAPKPAPTVPTDDHGQSNVVFSDTDADSSLIR